MRDRLRALPREQLRGMRRGIEKESLRTRPDGALALTPHAPALGSALAHPHITTDFSESQLISGVHVSAGRRLEVLTEMHLYRAIGNACSARACLAVCRQTTQRVRSAATGTPTSARRMACTGPGSG